MKTVLLVEDDTDLLALLRDSLEKEGYRVVVAQRSSLAACDCGGERVDMVVLDTATPGSDGLDACTAIYSCPEVAEASIALLVESASEVDRFGGQQYNISECIVKPFFIRDLLSRVRSRLHPQARSAGELRSGPLKLDRSAGKVTLNGIERSLTATELRLLDFLMSRPGVVFTRKQLLYLVWGDDRPLTTGNVAAFIKGLRKKIEQDPAHPDLIRSVRGFGYSFNEKAGNLVPHV